MRKLFLIALTAIILISCNDKITGEGFTIADDYELSKSVTKINISSAMYLELSDDIRPGTIVIKAQENIFQYINFEVQDDTVSISLDSNNYKDVFVSVYASSDQYSSIVASGASKVVVKDEISARNLDVSLSGASQFTLSEGGEFISKLSLNLSGASWATLNGTSSQSQVVALGASTITAKKFTCQYLRLDLSGASTLEMNVDGIATGTLSGASKFFYGGDTDLDIEASGSSQIKPM